MDRAAHGGRPGGGFISFAPPSVKSMRRRKVEGFQEGGGVPLCRRGWGGEAAALVESGNRPPLRAPGRGRSPPSPFSSTQQQ